MHSPPAKIKSARGIDPGALAKKPPAECPHSGALPPNSQGHGSLRATSLPTTGVQRWQVHHQGDRAYRRWIASGRTDAVAHAEASRCYDAYLRTSSSVADAQLVALLDVSRDPGTTTQGERLAMAMQVAASSAAEIAHMVATCQAALTALRRPAP